MRTDFFNGFPSHIVNIFFHHFSIVSINATLLNTWMFLTRLLKTHEASACVMDIGRMNFNRQKVSLPLRYNMALAKLYPLPPLNAGFFRRFMNHKNHGLGRACGLFGFGCFSRDSPLFFPNSFIFCTPLKTRGCFPAGVRHWRPILTT